MICRFLGQPVPGLRQLRWKVPAYLRQKREPQFCCTTFSRAEGRGCGRLTNSCSGRGGDPRTWESWGLPGKASPFSLVQDHSLGPSAPPTPPEMQSSPFPCHRGGKVWVGLRPEPTPKIFNSSPREGCQPSQEWSPRVMGGRKEAEAKGRKGLCGWGAKGMCPLGALNEGAGGCSRETVRSKGQIRQFNCLHPKPEPQLCPV